MQLGYTYYSLQFNHFEGKNLDFPLCTIPTVSLYEKYGVFGKTPLSPHLPVTVPVITIPQINFEI